MLETPYLFFALLMIPFRYFIIAGLFYLLFYIIKKQDWMHLKIQKKFPISKIIQLEIFYSFITMLIFALIALLIFKLYWSGYTLMYHDIKEYGIPYFIFSSFLIIVIHDFYFYCTHRAMHHKRLYPIIHKIHHISKNPTPWAAFSFHPIEAIIQIVWIPIIILCIPFHIISLAFWALYMMLFNVIGHLGYEIFPRKFMSSSIGQIFFSSTFHNMHHKQNNCNYGLYFIVWDKIFKTDHDDYKFFFNQIKLESK
tara:strand:- start:312 stop:1070 length:759 start_codon:yes stop_codon:yes gene_type:complete